MARYSTWTTRRGRGNAITHGRSLVIRALNRERAQLANAVEKSAWWHKTPEGYSLSFRVNRKIVVLDEATESTAWICETKEEANEWYAEKEREVNAGKYDELFMPNGGDK